MPGIVKTEVSYAIYCLMITITYIFKKEFANPDT
ncbi:hypothetical protein BACCAC_03647 [Bacteroides caccae ATCC 43185]|nr:hypothetical protein BACCAC_03647 [Bacteroides caccae ATCC 43185]